MRCLAKPLGLAALLVVVLLACGGTTSEGPSGGVDAGTDSATPSDAPLGDARVDAPPDGPSVRAVTCGAVECSRDGDAKSRAICCVTPGGPPQAKCTPEVASCNQGQRQCDDRADCSGGEVCCAETSNDGKMSTRCMPSCITGAPRWQVCKTSDECEGAGVPCTTGICPRQGIYGFCVGAALPDGCR